MEYKKLAQAGCMKFKNKKNIIVITFLVISGLCLILIPESKNVHGGGILLVLFGLVLIIISVVLILFLLLRTLFTKKSNL